MRTEHIPFQKMSDLYDCDVTISDDRDTLFEHIQSCGECTIEYSRLGKTLELVREFARHSSIPDALPIQTMKKIKFRRRRKLIIKSAPAIAASFLIITAVSLLNSGLSTGVRKSIIAESSARDSLTDSEQVIDIIRKHNATISDITDTYVEGTVPVTSFNSLRQDLGFRKVAYLLAEESSGVARDWGNAIEEVGAGDIRHWEPQGHDVSGSKKYISFRVYR